MAVHVNSALLRLFLLLSIAPPDLLAEVIPVGYQARVCGFDLNDDGVVGDPQLDCNVCDGVTLDPDGDGIAEDQIYIDSQAGSDITGDGSPLLPYRTIQHAWDQADGPGDGAEDILCFTGVAAEEEIIPGTSGVPGVRIKPRSGNEARDWEFPANPTMLIGWDTDDDGEYPPVDTDDLAVLDGAGNHVDSGLSRAFRFGAENSYLEVAHFTARDYGRFYPDEVDENGTPLDALPAGFAKFTTGASGIGGHMYLHDLWIENINMDVVGGSHRITFDFFIGHTILHHLAFINLKIPNTSSFLTRGAAPDLPNQGQDGSDYGPIRWQNLSVTAHGKDQAPGVSGGSLLGWKLWGYMTGLEILDSEFDANLDAWNVGTLSVDFVNATQCSRDWTIRNNLLLNVRDALTAQGGNGEFCGYDTVNTPPRSIPRTTDDIVFEGNVYINHHDQESVAVEIKGGDDPQRSIEDVSIQNNLFVTSAAKGFGWCVKAAAANDTGPGNPGRTIVANNTCFGAVNDSADRGAIVIGDTARPAHGQQANVIVANNLIAGMGDNQPRNIEMPRIPANLQLDANVYDDKGGYARPGLYTSDLATWRSVTGWDGSSNDCAPDLANVVDLDFRPQPFDVCAKDGGIDLSAWLPAVDQVGTLRPQQLQWDVGAFEVIEPSADEPPLRYAGAPAGTLVVGTTQSSLGVKTYAAATCRYGVIAGTPFDALPFTFETSDGMAHQAIIDGLTDGQDYELFVRCSDGEQSNHDDFRIAFTVAAPFVTSLVGHWPMDENLGSSVADSSGYDNDALLLNGGAWEAGVIGAALELDGQNDWMLVADPGSTWVLDLQTALTITAWVKPATVGSPMKFVTKDNIYELQLGHAGSGRYSLRLNNAGGGAGTTSIAAGQWQHLVASWDGDVVRYYYNGQPDGSSTFHATLNSNDNDVGIGARPPGTAPLSGTIDDVRIYNGALTDEQVLTLYQDRSLPPDTAAPLRGEAYPSAPLPIGTASTQVSLRTNESATCRYTTHAGVNFPDMFDVFASDDGLAHSTSVSGLSNGQHLTLYVRCEDGLGHNNGDDFPIAVSVLRPTPGGFSPADLDDIEFYIQSTVFEDPSSYSRSIATCNTATCFAAGNLAPIEQQYCDTTQFPEGCIRRWDDLSGYLPLGGFRPPEWLMGRNFGQDDFEKPIFIADCINGRPCARGGSGAKAPDGSVLPQNFSFEVEVGQGPTLPGPFSMFHLLRPVPQATDYQYFGLNGVIHRVADNSLSYRTSSSTVRLTQANAMMNGMWQLLEVHRDVDGRLRTFVNGRDVTWNTPLASGEAAGSNYLSRFKGDAPMFGDLAASISYSRRLTEQEVIDIRTYLNEIYDHGSSVPIDSVPPQRSNGTPRGQLGVGTTQAVLSVETDEQASCRFSSAPNVAFGAMEGTMGSASGLAHEAQLTNLGNDQAYRFQVKCRDAVGNENLDDYEIAFYIGSPGVEVGLLAFWPFEEGSGAVARNTSDATLDAILRNGPTWGPGQRGLAMSFDGLSQHAVVSDTGNGSPLDVTDAFTIAVWVSPQTLPTAGTVKLLSKDNIFEFEIGHAGPRSYSVRLNNTRRGQGLNLVEIGIWQHLAVTWDGTTVRYYLNGQANGSAAFAGPLNSNNTHVGIAARPVGSTGSGWFDGWLDELRLYGRALSDTEIAELVTPTATNCPETPALGCRVSTKERKSRLKMTDRDGDRDSLAWKWASGEATTLTDIGSPSLGGDYAFCLYDSVAGNGRLLVEQVLEGGRTCKGGRPCWKETTRGASYLDTGLSHGPIKRLSLRAGVAGKAKIGLLATGASLQLPPLPPSLDPWMKVQLHNLANGQCWEARYSEVEVRNESKLTAYSE